MKGSRDPCGLALEGQIGNTKYKGLSMDEITTAEEEKEAIKETIGTAYWEAADKWPSEFFTREGLATFSGNAFSVNHLANLDSKGDGPKGSFYNGRKRVYKKKSAVEWVIGRSKVAK